MSTLAPSLSPHDAAFAGFRGLEIVRGEGPFVFDSEGTRYLDATAMYGVASLGHAHPALAAALTEQAQTLLSCFASYGNDRRAALVERLSRLLEPLDRFYLCNSGTEAVEAALKVARAQTGRPGVVALSGAFHGRTMGALTATFRGKHRDAFQPLLEGFTHVRPGDFDALERALSQPTTGLFLVEVVQGEGGVRPIDAEFLRHAQDLCRGHGVLFGVDEVQSGVGRTGQWFAYREHDLDPDLVCLAKGLGGGVPIGALAFRSERGTLPTGSHGSTFGGNPLSAAAALAVLDVIEQEDLVQRAAENGARLLALLEERLADVAGVRQIRGRGLMIGLELAAPSGPIQKRLQERGFLVLGAGPRVLRLLPPLITPWDELERLAHAIVEEVSR